MRKERRQDGFTCSHCKGWVAINELIGTNNRNHCPTCLWSKHVDEVKAGDRKSTCHSGMKPIGVTIKQAGEDKYGKPRQGELMIIHQCTNEGKISINRIAADDNAEVIMKVFEDSFTMPEELRKQLLDTNIKVLDKSKLQEVQTQLFGRIRSQ